MARLPRGLKRAELVELLEIDERIKELEQRREVLKDKVARAHGDFLGLRTYGVVILDFGVQNRFDPARFQDAYPFEKRPEFYALTVDPKAVPKETKALFVKPVPTLAVRRAA